jgi:hypothetical protein
MPFSLLLLLLTVFQQHLLTHSLLVRDDVNDCANENYTRNYDEEFETAVKLHDGLRANKRLIDRVSN